MDQVQWLNDQGGWEIGRIFKPRGENSLVSSCYGLDSELEILSEEAVLIIPYHDPGNPVFVEYGKLTPRPDKHHE